METATPAAGRSKIDILDRQPFIDRLIDIIHLIAATGRGCTFSIEGPWGCGKSYVLEMLEEQLSLFQDKNAAGDKFAVFHYNCWQYDYYDEPAIAIISAIKAEIARYKTLFPQPPAAIQPFLEKGKALGKELLGNVLQTKLGVNPMELWDSYKEEQSELSQKKQEANAYDDYFQFKEVLDKTKQELADMAKDKPIVFVVDELDRCVPTYAIKVLERLHHLFGEDSNIIVILTIDRQQIDRTVRQIYNLNSGEAVTKYLRKFIRFSLPLDNGQLNGEFWTRHEEVLSQFLPVPTDFDYTLLYELTANLFQGMDVRTQDQIMDRLLTLHKLSFGQEKDMAILYFELLHQVLSHRIPSEDNLKWVVRLHTTLDMETEVELGTTLSQYLRQLEASTHASYTYSNEQTGSPQRYCLLTDESISVAFWMLSALSDTPQKHICGDYYSKNASEYEALVERAQLFHALSKRIL